MHNNEHDKKAKLIADAQLDAYFDGSDGLSSFHGAIAENEEPSEEINERILKAAQDELETFTTEQLSVSEKRGFAFPNHSYSIAASVLLSVSVAFFFLNNEPLRQKALQSSTDEMSEYLNMSVEFESLPSINYDIDYSRTFFEDELKSEISVGEAMPIQKENFIGADTEEAANPLAESERVSVSKMFSTSEMMQEQDLSSRAKQSNDSFISNLGITNEQALSGQATVSLLDENKKYRNAVDSWLQEILSLQTDNFESSQVERELFMKAHPEIDLESALNELL